MKRYLFSIALLALIPTMLPAQDAAAPDGDAIVKEVGAMMEAFNKGDADMLIDKTHPAIYKLAGGEENFKQTLRAGAKQIMELGVKIESFKAEAPKEFHQAGDEQVCFVPTHAVMLTQGMRIKSSSFMIAARKAGQGWYYLDGSSLKANPEMLWTFFPELDKGIKIPETTMEMLEKAPAE